MVFEETTGSLFPADSSFSRGISRRSCVEDLTQAMLELYRVSGIFAHEAPVRRVIDCVEQLDPAWVHPMPAAASPDRSRRASIAPCARSRSPTAAFSGASARRPDLLFDGQGLAPADRRRPS